MKHFEKLFCLGLIVISGCTPTVFTTPLCGPDSFDNRPVAEIPEAAYGCYRSLGNFAISMNDRNIFQTSDIGQDYFWIDKDVLGLPGDDKRIKSFLRSDGSKPVLCQVPLKGAHPNSRISMIDDHGGYLFQEYTFDTDRNVLSIGSYPVTPQQIQESKLRYAVITHWIGNSISKNYTYPQSKIFSGSIEGVLIDNSEISPEELFERLNMKRGPATVDLEKVDPSFCKTTKMQMIKL